MGLRRLILVGSCALALAACTLNDRSTQQKVEVLCTTGCECEEKLPSRREACVASCLADLGNVGAQISEDCLQCVVDHKDRCVTLENDCAPLCGGGPDPEPDPPNDFPDAGMGPLIDAF